MFSSIVLSVTMTTLVFWKTQDISVIMGRQVGGVKAIDSKYNLWAIPGSEIDINPKLTQNPGW